MVQGKRVTDDANGGGVAAGVDGGEPDDRAEPDELATLIASGISAEQAKQEILVSALARGTRYAAAGEVAGVSERTVRRRMSDPRFAADVAQRRTQYVNGVTGALLSGADQAVNVIIGALASEDTSTQLRAAQLMLTLVRRFHADTDLEARLVALEAEVNGAGSDE